MRDDTVFIVVIFAAAFTALYFAHIIDLNQLVIDHTRFKNTIGIMENILIDAKRFIMR